MLPNSNLVRYIIIIFMLPFQFIPTGLAIDVGFSVSDNGGTVAINDKYSVSDSVSVHESGTGGFRPASISSQRDVSGPGSINMAQIYSGSGGYNGFNYLFSNNASNNAVHSSASLTPNTLSVSQRASFSNAQQVKFCLGAFKGEELVKHYGWLNDGSLSMDQSLNVNRGGMEAMIKAHMFAQEGMVGSKAVDGLGSEAETFAKIYKGSLNTFQFASEPMASVSQYSDISALAAIAKSSASSYTGNKAGVLVKLTDGKMTTQQNAWADELAVAKETTKVWDAKGASSSSWAMNAQGDKVYSKVKVNLSDGTFNSSQFAVGNNDLDLRHQTDAGRALSATSFDYALVRDKYLASAYTNSTMDLGSFTSNSAASVDKSNESAAVHQNTISTNALEGFSKTLALEFGGNKSKTYAKALMEKGNFSSDLGAEASERGAFAVQNSNATLARQAWAGSYANDTEGEWAKAKVYVEMANGEFWTRESASSAEDASVYKKTHATKALTGSALSTGANPGGDHANTSVTAVMKAGMFNNTIGVVARDENVSIYHQANASMALFGSKSALAEDAKGNRSWANATVTMDNGQFDTILRPEADGGASVYEYLKATKVLVGVDRSHAEDGNSHNADSSVTVINGTFVNELMAKALGQATIDHKWNASGDSINAYINAEKPNERSYINTTVTKNTAKPATLSGLQTADSNSTGTETNQYIQARGRISSQVRSSSGLKTNESDLNYNSIGVDSHLWAATNDLNAYADRWTLFYLDDDVGTETIQSTVDEARDHPNKRDGIDLAEGRYKEHVTIDKSIFIRGHDPIATIVDGTNNGRVFTIGASKPSSIVSFSGLSIINGYVKGNDAIDGTGGNAEGGGVHNSARLDLTDVIVRDNVAEGGSGTGSNGINENGKNGIGGKALGGGLFNKGTLTLKDSQVINNTAIGGDGQGGNAQGGNGNEGNDGLDADDLGFSEIYALEIQKIKGHTGEAGGSGTSGSAGQSVSGGQGIGGQAMGGGIYSEGALTLESSKVSENKALGGDGRGGDAQGGDGGNGGDGGDGGKGESIRAWGIIIPPVAIGIGGDGGSAQPGKSSGAGGSGTGGLGQGGDAQGAGIYSSGSLTVVDGSNINENEALGGQGRGGSGIGGQGGEGGSGGNGGDAGIGMGVGAGLIFGYSGAISGTPGLGALGAQGGLGGEGMGGEGHGGKALGGGVFSSGAMAPLFENSTVRGNIAAGGEGTGGMGKGGDGGKGGKGGDGGSSYIYESQSHPPSHPESIGVGAFIVFGGGAAGSFGEGEDGQIGGEGGDAGIGTGGKASGGDAYGAGIYRYGDLAVAGSSISDNIAKGGSASGGEGIGGKGGSGGSGGKGGDGTASSLALGLSLFDVPVFVPVSVGVGIGSSGGAAGDGSAGGMGGKGGQGIGGLGEGGNAGGGGIVANTLDISRSVLSGNSALGGTGTGGQGTGGDGGTGGSGGRGGTFYSESSGIGMAFAESTATVVGVGAGVAFNLADDLGSGSNGGKGGDAGAGGAGTGGIGRGGDATGGAAVSKGDLIVSDSLIQNNLAEGGKGLGGDGIGGRGGNGGTGGDGGTVQNEAYGIGLGFKPGGSLSGFGIGAAISSGGSGGAGGAGGYGGIGQGGSAFGGDALGGGLASSGRASISGSDILGNIAVGGIGQGGDGFGGEGGRGGYAGSAGKAISIGGGDSGATFYFKTRLTLDDILPGVPFGKYIKINIDVSKTIGDGVGLGFGFSNAKDGSTGGAGGQGGDGSGGSGLGGKAQGGAIYANGGLVIDHSNISDNKAEGGSGLGGAGSGGAGGIGGTGGNGGTAEASGKGTVDKFSLGIDVYREGDHDPQVDFITPVFGPPTDLIFEGDWEMEFSVTGLKTDRDVQNVTNALNNLGLSGVTVDKSTGKVSLISSATTSGSTISPTQIKAAIESAGGSYTATYNENSSPSGSGGSQPSNGDPMLSAGVSLGGGNVLGLGVALGGDGGKGGVGGKGGSGAGGAGLGGGAMGGGIYAAGSTIDIEKLTAVSNEARGGSSIGGDGIGGEGGIGGTGGEGGGTVATGEILDIWDLVSGLSEKASSNTKNTESDGEKLIEFDFSFGGGGGIGITGEGGAGGVGGSGGEGSGGNAQGGSGKGGDLYLAQNALLKDSILSDSSAIGGSGTGGSGTGGLAGAGGVGGKGGDATGTTGGQFELGITAVVNLGSKDAGDAGKIGAELSLEGSTGAPGGDGGSGGKGGDGGNAISGSGIGGDGLGGSVFSQGSIDLQNIAISQGLAQGGIGSNKNGIGGAAGSGGLGGQGGAAGLSSPFTLTPTLSLFYYSGSLELFSQPFDIDVWQSSSGPDGLDGGSGIYNSSNTNMNGWERGGGIYSIGNVNLDAGSSVNGTPDAIYKV
jgi:hypothetical protein